MDKNIIEIYNLSKSFKKKKALENISLKIKKGSITGLFGENGAGKTTLMKLITNQIKPDNGKILVNDVELEFNNKVNASMGCLLEHPSLYPYLTSHQHLSLINLLNSKQQSEFIEELMKIYGLYEFKELKSKEYSLGMKQRLGLAMAELSGDEILILDEPFNGLDPISINKFRKRIIHLKTKGVTIILSSHLIREIEDLIDNLVIISNGKLINSLRVDEFMKDKEDSLEKEILKIMEA